MGYTTYPHSAFILRTVFNRNYIDENSNANGPYEFTQLVNSFLMAFIHPKALWIDEIPEQPMPPVGWPNVNTEPKHRRNAPSDSRQLVKRIRNALAHGNFDILTAGQGQNREIDAVTLWNTPNEESTERIWETTLTVTDLQKIFDAFAASMLTVAKRDENA